MSSTPGRSGRQPSHTVILCHPDPASFNRAIADTYCDAAREIGHDVRFRDLYALGFDPVLKASERPDSKDFALSPDVQAEIDHIRHSDVFVLIYPIWFGTPPAMLKGYVERVLGAGFSIDNMTEHKPHSFLEGKRLVSFTTSSTTMPWLQGQGQWQSLRQVFDHYLTRAFSMRSDHHVHFPAIVTGLKQRFIEEHLAVVRSETRLVCSGIAHEHHARRLQSRRADAPAS